MDFVQKKKKNHSHQNRQQNIDVISFTLLLCHISSSPQTLSQNCISKEVAEDVIYIQIYPIAHIDPFDVHGSYLRDRNFKKNVKKKNTIYIQKS